MKTLFALMTFCLSLTVAEGMERPVGSVSRNQSFALRDGSGFAKASLDDQSGKIVVIMMMTPWCPICQSHAKLAGEGILDHYWSSKRGKLRGKNANGVPIVSILLSTETGNRWNKVNSQFAAANGFRNWGLDSNPDRSKPRTLLGYYRGGLIRSSDLNDWGDDRRRLVVINMSRNSSSHQYREILINQNEFTSADFSSARRAIDAVRLAK